MRSKWFLWLVAVLIGSALAFPPIISAAEKEKKAAQPCAAGEMKEKKEEKKDAKKAKKAAKKKGEKEESKQPCAAQPCAAKKK